jgi:putative transposase
VLGWAVSNAVGTSLCLEALEMTLGSTGRFPEILNTDHGRQFTSAAWTGHLTELGVKIGMEGRGRSIDNVFILQLWISLKYEVIYLKEDAPSVNYSGPSNMVQPLQPLAPPPESRQADV